MFGEVIRLWENGEYSYPLACGFVPNLVSYIHESSFRVVGIDLSHSGKVRLWQERFMIRDITRLC